MKIKKLQTSSFRPSSNVVERSHSSLGNYLRCHVDANPGNWDRLIKTAMFVANNTVHRGTNHCPAYLLFGFVSQIPVTLKHRPEPVYNDERIALLCRRDAHTSCEIARKHLAESKVASKRYHDRKLNQHQFHVGDLAVATAPPRSKKLDPKFIGVYEIIHIFDDNTVSVKRRGKNIPKL